MKIPEYSPCAMFGPKIHVKIAPAGDKWNHIINFWFNQINLEEIAAAKITEKPNFYGNN